MKRAILATFFFTVLAIVPAWGQAVVTNADGSFRHLGVSAGIGTTGVSLQASTNVNVHLGLRGGIDIVDYHYDTNLAVEFLSDQYSAETIDLINLLAPTDLRGKFHFITGNLFLDVYPSRHSSFRFALGAYYGTSHVVDVYNRKEGSFMPVNMVNEVLISSGYADPVTHKNMLGVPLGDYFLLPDEDGNVQAYTKVMPLRPYIGVGLGRSVPQNHRLACSFDLGAQFWGTPKVYLQGERLESSHLHGSDGGIIRMVSKFSVWPVASFRLVWRVF